MANFQGDDHIYYSVTIANTYDHVIPAEYNENLMKPLVENPSLYNLSLIVFDIPTNEIPIFVFEPNTYYVTLRNTVTSAESTQVVTLPLPGSDSSPNYVYSIGTFLYGVNTALDNAATALGAPAPSISFDPVTGLFTITADSTYELPTPTYELYFNYKLYLRFESFFIKFLSYNSASKKDILFYFTDTKSVQEAVNNSMTDIAGLIIKSLSFGTSQLNISVRAPGLSTNTQANNAQDSVLNSFVVSPAEFRTPLSTQSLTYTPSLYRLININRTEPISQINLQVFWTDRVGNLYPVEIAPGRSLRMLLLFLKRPLYS